MIFWNDVREKRIVVSDENHLRFGEVILGGGWIEKEFKDLTINQLDEKRIKILEKIPQKEWGI